MKTRLSLATVRQEATLKGLSIDSYNPGDGIRYKVDAGLNKSYFQMSISSLYRCSTLRQAAKFISKYGEAKQ